MIGTLTLQLEQFQLMDDVLTPDPNPPVRATAVPADAESSWPTVEVARDGGDEELVPVDDERGQTGSVGAVDDDLRPRLLDTHDLVQDTLAQVLQRG
jgi:hypothetical protein